MPSTYSKISGMMGSADNLIWIDPKTIMIDPGQNPRSEDLDLESLKPLILANGFRLDGAISVYRGDDNAFHLINGQRRLLSVLALIEEGHQFPRIPAIVIPRMADPLERLLSALAANDGKPLLPIEEARAYARFIDNGWSIEDIAQRVGRSGNFLRGRLTLLDAVPAVTQALHEGSIALHEAVSIVRTAEKEGLPQALQLEKIHVNKHDQRTTRYQTSDEEKILQALQKLEDKYGVDKVRTVVQTIYRGGISSSM